MTIRLAVLFALALSPAVAAAAPATSDQDADEAARRPAAAGQAQEFIYDDEEIDGDSLHPDHQSVHARVPTRHASMIHVRAHFIPQLLAMATDI